MEGLSFKDTEHFLPLRLGETARDTLQEFIDIDVTAEDLVRILRRNPAYKSLFARFVNQKTRPRRAKPATEAEGEKEREPPTPTHRLISLLGMIGSRNLILALRMHEAVEGDFPWGAEDPVELKAGEYVNRGLEMEEVFQRAKLEYPETAYAAGVYFDWLRRVLSRHPDFKKSLEPYFERSWKRAVKTGLLAYFLAGEVRSLNPKQALVAGFSLHAGKLLMAMHLNGYAEWEVAADERKEALPLSRAVWERQRFGLAFEEISSHLLRYFDIFHAVLPAVRAAREPYLAADVDHVQYVLASVLYLADTLAREWKIPADEKDPLFDGLEHPSLKHLKLSRAAITRIIRQAMAVR